MGIWLPKSEAEIEAGLSSGDVPEGHFLDFKRELGASTSARKETAQDIASFAIDGGALIVGVSEPEPGKYELSPVPLDNLSERAEQIAANRPDPGLAVRTNILPSIQDPARGYLVIEVPPSPGAPHMVDGRYWGRSERTKRILGNDEVVRLHSRRVDYESVIRSALTVERERQPLPVPRSRMFLVAEPLQAPESMARQFTRGDARMVNRLIAAAEPFVPPSVETSYPNPQVVRRVERRARGIAATSLAQGRKTDPQSLADGALDIEVWVSGGIRAMVSEVTYHQDHPRLPEGITHVVEDAVVAWTHRLVGWAKALSDEIEYRGPWGFGVLIVGLAGARALPTAYERRLGLPSMDGSLPIYDAGEHEAVATATYQEMELTPSSLVDRLVGDVIHALGVADRYTDALA